LFNRIL
jgi:hypothetical protein